MNGWENVIGGMGSTEENYTTAPLSSSTYYRAEISSPGFNAAYSNSVYIDVIPALPVISQSGDTLISSAAVGNQWYDENGLIPGATGQNYLALDPGEYYVVVTLENCTSFPSNIIQVFPVATDETGWSSQIRIYPNPVGDVLYIEVDDEFWNRLVSASRTMEFEILDLMGRNIFKGRLIEKLVVDTKGVLPGLYFIKMKRSGFVGVRCVIKR